MLNKFLTSNKAKWRTLRTITQGVIGVFIANLDMLIAGLGISPNSKAVIVALVMTILAPIMKSLGSEAEG